MKKGSDLTRQNLIWLSISTVVLALLGVVLFLAGWEGIGIAVMVGGSIVGTVAWIMALIMAGQRQQWGWLVVIALTTTIGTLLYAVMGFDDSRIIQA